MDELRLEVYVRPAKSSYLTETEARVPREADRDLPPEVEKKMARIKEEQCVAALEPRPLYAEKGSVTLPRFAFSWLAGSRDQSWTVSDMGMLFALLGMFENRQRRARPHDPWRYLRSPPPARHEWECGGQHGQRGRP